MIPPPVLDEQGYVATPHALLVAAVHCGIYGTCVMCGRVTYAHLDLSELDMEPVTDDHGDLTDQLPLHPEHVPDLLEHWATLSVAAPDDAEPVEPVVRGAANPAVPEPGQAMPIPAQRAPAVAPMGAYARRLARQR
jgi:hypothetical protein